MTSFALYEAYGTRPYEWGDDPDRQKANTKEEESDLGLLNEGMRFRDLETGVFLTRDPIGYGDGPNVYCYVHCNPITRFDAFGLEGEEVTGDNSLTALATQDGTLSAIDSMTTPEPVPSFVPEVATPQYGPTKKAAEVSGSAKETAENNEAGIGLKELIILAPLAIPDLIGDTPTWKNSTTPSWDKIEMPSKQPPGASGSAPPKTPTPKLKPQPNSNQKMIDKLNRIKSPVKGKTPAAKPNVRPGAGNVLVIVAVTLFVEKLQDARAASAEYNEWHQKVKSERDAQPYDPNPPSTYEILESTFTGVPCY